MDFISGNISVVAIVVAVVIVVALLSFVASRVRRVPPNEALIVVGRGAERSEGGGISSPQKVIIGGRTFVWPIFQEGFKLSLEQYQTPVEVQAIDANYTARPSRRRSTSRSPAPKTACVAPPSATCCSSSSCP
jgi:flotillin